MEEPKEYISESEPKCPYCGTDYGDAWELELGDSEYIIVTCPECEKDYEITCCISITYDTCAPEPINEKVERARKYGYKIPDNAAVGTIVKKGEYSYEIVEFGPYIKMNSVGSGIVGITF